MSIHVPLPLTQAASPRSLHDRIGVRTSGREHVVFTKVNEQLLEIDCTEPCPQSEAPAETIRFRDCERFDNIVSNPARTRTLVKQGFLHIRIGDLETDETAVAAAAFEVNEQQNQIIQRNTVHPPAWKLKNKFERIDFPPLHFFRVTKTALKVSGPRRRVALDPKWVDRSNGCNVEQSVEFDDLENISGRYTTVDVCPQSANIAEQRRLLGLLSPPLPTSPRMQASTICSPGIATPYLYISGLDSVTALHIEDCGLYSANILHRGAPKIWVIVHPLEQEKLELCIRAFLQLNDCCSSFVRHESVFIPPSTLLRWKIRFAVVCQRPGDLVITDVNAYHQVRNLGHNIAEAVNFMVDCDHPNTAWKDCGRSCPDGPILKSFFCRKEAATDGQLDLPEHALEDSGCENKARRTDNGKSRSQKDKGALKSRSSKPARRSGKRPMKSSKSVAQLRPAGYKKQEIATEDEADVDNGEVSDDEMEEGCAPSGSTESTMGSGPQSPIEDDDESGSVDRDDLYERNTNGITTISDGVECLGSLDDSGALAQAEREVQSGNSLNDRCMADSNAQTETKSFPNTDLSLQTGASVETIQDLHSSTSCSARDLQPTVEDADDSEPEVTNNTGNKNSQSLFVTPEPPEDEIEGQSNVCESTERGDISPPDDCSVFSPAVPITSAYTSNITTPSSSPLVSRSFVLGQKPPDSQKIISTDSENAADQNQVVYVGDTDDDSESRFQAHAREWANNNPEPNTNCEQLLLEIARQERRHCIVGGMHLSWDDLTRLLPGNMDSRFNGTLLEAIITDAFSKSGHSFRVCISHEPQQLSVLEYQYVICLMHDRDLQHWWLVVLRPSEMTIQLYDDFERDSAKEQVAAMIGHDLFSWQLRSNKLSHDDPDGINCGTFVIARALNAIMAGLPTTAIRLREYFLRSIMTAEATLRVTNFTRERVAAKRPLSPQMAAQSKIVKLTSAHIQVASIPIEEKARSKLVIGCGPHLVTIQQWRRGTKFKDDENGDHDELSVLYTMDASLYQTHNVNVLEQRMISMRFHRLFNSRVSAKRSEIQRAKNARRAQKARKVRDPSSSRQDQDDEAQGTTSTIGKGAPEYIYEETFSKTFNLDPSTSSQMFRAFRIKAGKLNADGKRWSDFWTKSGVHPVLVPSSPIHILTRQGDCDIVTIEPLEVARQQWSPEDFPQILTRPDVQRLAKSREIMLDEWDSAELHELTALDLAKLLAFGSREQRR